MRHYVRLVVVVLIVWDIFSLFPPRLLPNEGREKAPVYFRSGIIHVHSTYSDGGGKPDVIAEAAQKAGMDFVVLTDHNNSIARKDGYEKSYGQTDLLVEMEATTPAGHCLMFFSHTDAVHLDDRTVNAMAWKHFLKEETRDGVFLAVSHPTNLKNPWTHLDRFTEGYEVVNFDSVWQRQAAENLLEFLGTVSLMPFNAFLSTMRFFQAYPKDFVAWDGMNAISKGHFGILAHDTHAKLKLNNDIMFRWPDYLETFKMASNVVFVDSPIPEDFATRKKQLYRAIQKGKLAMAFHSIFPFAGNDWTIQCRDSTARAGDDVGVGGCKSVVTLPPNFPHQAVIRLWKDSELLKEWRDVSGTVELPIELAGIYRAEVFARPKTLSRTLIRHDVPYVFYNPIYVR